MKKDIRVIRMIAAVLTMFFGSVWIALYISNEVAPPEPDIARLGRHASLVMFIVSGIWGSFLWAGYQKEERLLRQGSRAARRDPGEP